MNERIRLLAEQAGMGPMGIAFSSEIMQKFAQLIIRECMDQVWYDREAIVSDRISESIKERICQHFGVEE